MFLRTGNVTFALTLIPSRAPPPVRTTDLSLVRPVGNMAAPCLKGKTPKNMRSSLGCGVNRVSSATTGKTNNHAARWPEQTNDEAKCGQSFLTILWWGPTAWSKKRSSERKAGRTLSSRPSIHPTSRDNGTNQRNSRRIGRRTQTIRKLGWQPKRIATQSPARYSSRACVACVSSKCVCVRCVSNLLSSKLCDR